MGSGILENDSMFSVGQRPWHGLGKVLENAPTIAEGIKQAGLDWEVSLEDMKVNEQIVPMRKATVRKDTNEILGVVGNNYKILQNKDAFNFFEPFLESGFAELETAGSLFNGKRTFILAKIKSDNIIVDKNDEVEKYILLSNSHDGSQAVRVGFTPIRVVCNNTLSLAEGSEQSQLIRTTHKGDIVTTIENLRETMDLVNQKFMATEEQYKYLATRHVNLTDLHKYVKQVYSVKKFEELLQDDEKEIIEQERKRLISRVEEIFDLEPVHNAWTMYNSLNYYFNHEKSKDLENRYNSMWFGNSKTQDRKALQLAMTY